MSYEVWGDDDDGLDDVRESYRKTLLEDGWLDDEQARKAQTRSIRDAACIAQAATLFSRVLANGLDMDLVHDITVWKRTIEHPTSDGSGSQTGRPEQSESGAP